VLQMACVLSLPPVVILGHLHALWHAILEQQEDGDLSSWPDDMIAQAAAYTRDSSAFVRALQGQKFLDGKVVHDWLDYAGRYLSNKYRTSNLKKLKAIYKLHRSASRTVSGQTTVCPKSDNLPNQPDLTRPDPPNQPNQEKKQISREVTTSTGTSVKTWKAYAEAYRNRYGVEPVRNKSVNSMLCKLVEKLGAEEAPAVAAFYVTHQGQFYVAKMHPVNLLVADAEKLRTEWATGRQVTNGYAAQVDRTSTTGQVFKKLLAEEEVKREQIRA
jgi:hypothetical protein